MKLLLDTHIAMWAVTRDPRLSRKALTLLTHETNELFFSVISLWEIGVKYALPGKRTDPMPVSAARAMQLFIASGLTPLDFTPSHALQGEALPPIHRDPFDRLLVAQALAEPLRLVTHDPQIAAYSDTVILV
jgi:PIN domain nuclease of toxin-antitoxin system